MRKIMISLTALTVAGMAAPAAAQPAGDSTAASAEDAYKVGETLPEGRYAFLDPRSYFELPERGDTLYAYKDGWAYLLDPDTRIIRDVVSLIQVPRY